MTYSVLSHYLNKCWIIINCTLRHQLQWNFSQKSNFFIQENAFENVCEMAAILSREDELKCHGIFQNLISHFHTCLWAVLNTWRQTHNGHHFAVNFFKQIFLIKHCCTFKSQWNLFPRFELSISHHWFSNGLALNRQQAISCANVDRDVWCHMVSWGCNELIDKKKTWNNYV